MEGDILEKVGPPFSSFEATPAKIAKRFIMVSAPL